MVNLRGLEFGPPTGDSKIEPVGNSLILNWFLADLGGVYHTAYHRKCARNTGLDEQDPKGNLEKNL